MSAIDLAASILVCNPASQFAPNAIEGLGAPDPPGRPLLLRARRLNPRQMLAVVRSRLERAQALGGALGLQDSNLCAKRMAFLGEGAPEGQDRGPKTIGKRKLLMPAICLLYKAFLPGGIGPRRGRRRRSRVNGLVGGGAWINKAAETATGTAASISSTAGVVTFP
jgi:hypothetical protein